MGISKIAGECAPILSPGGETALPLVCVHTLLVGAVHDPCANHQHPQEWEHHALGDDPDDYFLRVEDQDEEPYNSWTQEPDHDHI